MRAAYPRRHVKMEKIKVEVKPKKYAAKNKRNSKKFDRISLIVPKGQRDVIKAYCEERGETMNGLINRLLETEIEDFRPVDSERRYGAERNECSFDK